MKPRWDILGLGSATLDDLLYVPSFPTPDTKMQITRSERRGGGLTATALVTATRLGMRCAFAGRLGSDEISRWIQADLARQGVDVSQVVWHEDSRFIHAVIIVEAESHTRTILYEVQGSLGADDEHPDDDVLRSTRVLFVDDFGIPGHLRAAEIALAAGIPVVGDFERHQIPRLPELVEKVNHLIVSARFAAPVTGTADPAEAVTRLWHDRRAIVVVTGGDQGCWYTADGKQVLHQPAFPVEALDTTGCGDVFHGAYAASLVWGFAPPERIRFASAAAALKASQAGGWRALPTREQVDQFLEINTG